MVGHLVPDSMVEKTLLKVKSLTKDQTLSTGALTTAEA
jgi:hypothetical protein